MKIHMIGIGGAGMSGIAEVLARGGHEVTGSDLKESPYTRRLRGAGVTVYIGHASEQVGDADQVVISTAIPKHEPRAPGGQADGPSPSYRGPRPWPGSWRATAASPSPGRTARRRRPA